MEERAVIDELLDALSPAELLGMLDEDMAELEGACERFRRVYARVRGRLEGRPCRARLDEAHAAAGRLADLIAALCRDDDYDALADAADAACRPDTGAPAGGQGASD